MISSLLAGILSRGLSPVISDFSWFKLIPGMSGHYSYGWSLGMADGEAFYFVPTAWAVVFAILGFAFMARRGLERALAREGNAKYLPDNGISARNVAEIMIGFVWGMLESNVGKKEAKTFFALVASLFMYVLFSNLSGFIPGFLPPTDNFSTNFAIAGIVFLTFTFVGLTRDPKGFIQHLAGPVWWLYWLIFPLEVISLFIRPMSLTIRLTVNIFVDHLLQHIAREVGGMLPYIGAAILPVPLYALGTLVCVIQAFIFSLLTCIYISQSLPHHAHDDDHGHH